MSRGIKSFFLFGAFWVMAWSSSVGQDASHFTQFYFNPSALNPSFTGIDGQSAAFLSYRKQWVGIEGAPTVSQFSFQAPNPHRIAVGLNFNQDKRGPVSTSTAMVSTGYNIPINKEVYMRFGMSVGAGFFRTDMSALKFSSVATDPVMTGLLQNDIQLLANAGVSFHSKLFHLGLAIPHLFQNNYLSTTAFGVGSFKPLDQLIIHGSYRYYLSKGKFLFEPYVNYRLNINMPSQLELAGVLHMRNMAWVGASYKQDFGLSGLFGFKFSPTIALGYAYSIKNTGINELASPSHEVQLGFLFGTRHRNIPAYSFVNAEKPKQQRGKPATPVAQSKKKPAMVVTQAKPVKSSATPPKNVVVAPPRKTSPVVASNQSRPAGQNSTPPATQPATRPPSTQVTRPVATQQPRPQPTTPAESQAASRLRNQTTEPVADDRDRPNNQQAGAPRLTEKIGGLDQVKEDEDEGEEASAMHGTRHVADSLQEVDELDRLDRLEDHKNNPTEAQVGAAANENRFEQVQRGNHPKELNVGDFVVVGMFKTEANARKWADGLKALGFPELEYGYSSANSNWFVHFKGADDLNAAKSSMEKYRKLKIFKDAWILTVKP